MGAEDGRVGQVVRPHLFYTPFIYPCFELPKLDIPAAKPPRGVIADEEIALANGVGYGRRSVFGPMGIGNPFFPGFNPSGEYSIRILVTNGEVILMGDVDSVGDKYMAAIKARGVFPVKKVFNQLTVKGKHPEVPEPQVKPGKNGVVTITE